MFDTILKLYSYLTKTWTDICNPSDCEQLYSNGSWKWDAKTRCAANGLRHTFCSFGHMVVFMLAKQLLEPIHPIAQCLQGKLQEVYFGYQRIDETINCYKQMHTNVAAEHSRFYEKAKALAVRVNSEKTMPRLVGQQTSMANPSVSSPTDYCRVTVTVPFNDTIQSELGTRFVADKRAHFELCSLVQHVITKKDDLEETIKILTSKWTLRGNLQSGSSTAGTIYSIR